MPYKDPAKERENERARYARNPAKRIQAVLRSRRNETPERYEKRKARLREWYRRTNRYVLRDKAFSARMKQERFFHWKWLMFRSHNKLRTHPLIYSFTENDLEALWNRQNGLCALTDRPLSKIGDTAQLDHIIPLARGGTNELDNLRWVTSMANYVKHSLLDEELLLLAQDLIQKAKHPVLPPAREVDIKQTNSLGI